MRGLAGSLVVIGAMACTSLVTGCASSPPASSTAAPGAPGSEAVNTIMSGGQYTAGMDQLEVYMANVAAGKIDDALAVVPATQAQQIRTAWSSMSPKDRAQVQQQMVAMSARMVEARAAGKPLEGIPMPQGAAAAGGPVVAPENRDPSIEVLESIVNSGQCQKLNKMTPIASKLPDDEARVKISRIVSGGTRPPGRALTEWLVLAAKYQELCNETGTPETMAATYVEQSVPMSEQTLEKAVKQGRCAFVAAVDEYGAWPHEVTFSHQLLSRDFDEAEITRKVWRETMADYGEVCGGMLSRRQEIRVETEIERLDRIIGLDDDTLISLRSKMLDALEHGKENKVLAYAQAIAQREKALDEAHSSRYDAKLAAIESELQSARAQVATLGAEARQAKMIVSAPQGRQYNGANAAETAANVAKTAENVAKAARAAKTLVRIGKTFF